MTTTKNTFLKDCNSYNDMEWLLPMEIDNWRRQRQHTMAKDDKGKKRITHCYNGCQM